MDLQEWKAAAKARLAKLAVRVKKMAPGTVCLDHAAGGDGRRAG
jgi:hypothetical protein